MAANMDKQSGISGKGLAACRDGNDFLSDVVELRRRARQHMQDGAVKADQLAARDTVLRLLNEALATELVCVLRYRRHYTMTDGALAEAIKLQFLKHSQEEQAHADRLAERIVQLGGAPDLTPDNLASRHDSADLEDETLADMLAEDLIAERIAIESYREMVQFVDDRDPTTRRLFESILAVEQEHARELSGLREGILRAQRDADHRASLSSGELQ